MVERERCVWAEVDAERWDVSSLLLCHVCMYVVVGCILRRRVGAGWLLLTPEALLCLLCGLGRSCLRFCVCVVAVDSDCTYATGSGGASILERFRGYMPWLDMVCIPRAKTLLDDYLHLQIF